jgi:hypothetical protein
LTLDEVLTLINNLDMREPLRRYGPKWSTVFVGRAGEILGVHRHKESLEKGLAIEREDAGQYPPDTAYFIATPGMFITPKQLKGKLKDAVMAYELEGEIAANPEQR